MDKKTVDERIEELVDSYRKKLQEKKEALMTIEGPNAITLSGIESIWGELNKEGEKLTGEFLSGFVSGNLQNELLRKKKELEKTGYNVRNGGKRPYNILTLNGDIGMNRTILRLNLQDKVTGENHRSEVSVLDEYFRIKELPHKATPEVTKEICFWAQNQGSYESAQEIMRNKMGINVSDEYIRINAMEMGEKVFNDDTRKSDDTEEIVSKIPPKPTRTGFLYIMVDGSMICTREKDGEGKAVWKEVKLAIVFNSNDLKAGAGGKKHIIKKKDYAVSVGDVNEFSKYLLECALRNGYGDYEKTIVISDGATWIRNLCYDIFPGAIQILDFYHLAEHVYNAGKELFGDDRAKYVPWSKNIISLLKEGKWENVLEMLSEDKVIPACIQKLHTYIFNNSGKLDYATYIQSGYFIGSGPVESANKVVVQRRCKQSGMRWNLRTAQFMLSLRSKFESGLWHGLSSRLLSTA